MIINEKGCLGQPFSLVAIKKYKMTSRFNINVYVIAVLAPCFLLAFFYIYKGILLDTDSKIYLFASQDFIHTNALHLPDGSPLVIFPPLFPLMLSGLQYMFHTVKVPFMVLNILFLGIGNYFAVKIILICTIVKEHKSMLLVLYTCSTTLFLCFVYLYSESMFYPICMFYIYLKLSKDKQSFFFKAILLTLMYLTRYAGLIFLISFFSWDLYHAKKEFSKKVVALIKEYALPTIIVILWSTYCYTKVGNATGDPIGDLNISAMDALNKEVIIVSNWLLPFCGGLVLACALIIYNFWPQKLGVKEHSLQIGYHVFFYLFALFCLRLVPRAEIEERTLFPIYFMFCLWSVYMVNQAFPKCSKYLVASILCYSLFRFAKNYLFWLNEY